MRTVNSDLALRRLYGLADKCSIPLRRCGVHEKVSGSDFARSYTQLFMPLLDQGFLLAFTHARPAAPDADSASEAISEVMSTADNDEEQDDAAESEAEFVDNKGSYYKQVVVDDFLCCVRHLLAEQYTCASKLAVLVSLQ